MSNIPVNTIMVGKLKTEIKEIIGHIGEYVKSTELIDPSARNHIKESLVNLENAYNKLDRDGLKNAIAKDQAMPKLRDSLNIPSQLAKGSLDQKTVPHKNMKDYNHSLEKIRDTRIN